MADWQHTTYRRLYQTGNDPAWLLLPLPARMCGAELIRWVDDDGCLYLRLGESHGEAVVRVMSGDRQDVPMVSASLAELAKPVTPGQDDPYVILEPHAVRIRNFALAQGIVGTTAERAKERSASAIRSAEWRSKKRRSGQLLGDDSENTPERPANAREHETNAREHVRERAYERKTNACEHVREHNENTAKISVNATERVREHECERPANAPRARDLPSFRSLPSQEIPPQPPESGGPVAAVESEAQPRAAQGETPAGEPAPDRGSRPAPSPIAPLARLQPANGSQVGRAPIGPSEGEPGVTRIHPVATIDELEGQLRDPAAKAVLRALWNSPLRTDQPSPDWLGSTRLIVAHQTTYGTDRVLAVLTYVLELVKVERLSGRQAGMRFVLRKYPGLLPPRKMEAERDKYEPQARSGYNRDGAKDGDGQTVAQFELERLRKRQQAASTPAEPSLAASLAALGVKAVAK